MNAFTSRMALGAGICFMSAALLQAQPSGQWDFNSGNLNATVGQPLEYADGATAGLTMFGTTVTFGLPPINGTNAAVMKFPASINGGGGFNMPTPAPNGGGGGTLVNNYTIIADILYPATANNRIRPLVQTDDGLITPEADLIVGANNGLGITPGGPFTGTLLTNTWYRIAFVVDTANGVIRKYINGADVGTHNIAPLGSDHQYALTGNGFSRLFANTGTNATEGYINSLQIRDVALNGGQMSALGGPSADGILQVIPAVPSFIQTRAPDANATGVYPKPDIAIVINRGDTTIDVGSVQLSFDNVVVGATVTPSGDQVNVNYTVPTLLRALSVHSIKLVYSDSTAGFNTNTWMFTVTDYQSVTLPSPIHLETFDGTAEGDVPAGWVRTNATTGATAPDLNNPDSDAYKDFTVISSNRLATLGAWDAARRIDLPPIAVNGQLIDRLVHGNLLYAESDTRGGTQVQVIYSPDFDLTGHNNVFVAWNSTREQNQDDIAGAEYSVDGGVTWNPIIYYIQCCIDGQDAVADVHRFPDGSIDPVATLNFVDGGAAYGQKFGNFLLVDSARWPTLAPFISPQINDDPRDSKQIELVRLPLADNAATVRLRFFQAGTASWYFGIDDVGFYSINTPVISTQPQSQTVDAGTPVIFSVVAVGDPPLSYQWQFNGSDIPGATSSSYTNLSVGPANAGQYQVTVSNPSGPTLSAVAVLTVNTNALIVTQPLSQTVDPNTAVTFSVVARGGQPLSYQWYKNNSVIGGATATNHNIASAQVGDTGDYLVVVTNSFGSVTSRVARLTVFSGSVTQELVVHMRFDGDNNDSSGRNNHGAAVGAPGFGTGKIGSGALQFTTLQDGSSYNYVTLGTAADVQFGATNDFSVSFWAKLPPNSWKADPAFIANKNWNSGGNVGWVAAANGGGEFQWNYREVAPNDRKDYDHPTGVFSDNNWHHFLMVFIRGGRALTYVDGLQANSQILATGQNAPTTIDSGLPTNIGQDGMGSYTDGNNVGITNALIDDVGIWRRAVTPNEAASIYVQGNTGNDLTTASGAPSALPPAVTTQPQSVFASLGGSVTFSVASGGTAPFTYIWQKDGADVSGATSSNLTINPVQISAAGDYRVIVANSAGSATSQVARLSVFAGTAGDALVAYLKFEGNYSDSSGRGNHGAASGTPSFAGGRVGQAVHINTAADGSAFNYVTLGYPTDLQFDTNSFSVAFWVNYTSATDDPGLIGNKNWDSSSNIGWGAFHQGSPNSFRVVATGTPRGSGNRMDTTIGTPNIHDGAWHQVVLTFWRGQSTAIYVDGQLVRTTPLTISGSVDTVGQTWTRGTATGGFAVNIGQDGTGRYIDNGGGITGGTAGIDALMDEVMMWRRVVTPQEVAALYAAGASGQDFILALGNASVAGGNITIRWSGGVPPFTVQRKGALSDLTWIDILTTSANSASVPTTNGAGFFRVQGH